MTYLMLFDEIKKQTEQLCLLSSQGAVESCPNLLEHRQRLLEKLHDELVKKQLLSHENDVKTAYIALLEMVQKQDNRALSLLQVEREDMQHFFQQQPKIKKAISTYHNVQLN